MANNLDSPQIIVQAPVMENEGSFKNKDGLSISTRTWTSQSEQPKALIFICHGYGDHSKRYSKFLAQALVDEGFFVLSHDHVGHGKSEGERAQIDSLQKYVRDIFDHIDQIIPKYEGLPIYLFGHSMGGLIAVLAAQRRPTFFKGVVLSAPALIVDPHKDNKCMRFLGKMVSWVAPSLQLLPAMDPNSMSRDPEQVKAYAEDPLVWHGGVKVGIGLAIAHAVDEVQASMESIKWPFLVLHGTADTLCLMEGSKQLERRAGSKDKTIKTYDGYYHDLLKEPKDDSTVILKDIIEWLNARM
ncbi:predicted protein [Nematostella vectensis]|uniref:Serine aminopeptidase S33 domain-containing protein n=1 Tax=Nematostella vectensis TaxID=45351 RepID=A7T3M9_NEMVE|nr:monoglyceride lipase [Nematostella vectensis]EDO29435.1 predicted protein [Nematostella vectensis]|eukprot:XP_001621535.1 hypothetical protein NEMVEDRAFT_v1g195674 [Nematostella vectensis]